MGISEWELGFFDEKPELICTNCQKPQSEHCPKCMACSEVHTCLP